MACWAPGISLPQMDPYLHPCRTIGWMSSCGSNGTTHDWPTKNILMTHWTLTLPCWILSGNQTCSLPMRKGPTSMRWPQTTSYCASSRMGMCSTASGMWESLGQKEARWNLRGGRGSSVLYLTPVNQCHLFLTVPARLTLILSCPMDLKNFPMDIQTCIMQLESCKCP